MSQAALQWRGAKAAELLMPASWIRADTKGYSLDRLATRYKVSREAMAYRLSNLRLVDEARGART